ncbi:MAG: flagellar hook-basal body complex protein FliE [Pseudomonadota bacterium]
MEEVTALSTVLGETSGQAALSTAGIQPDQNSAVKFSELITSGIADVESKVDAANEMVRSFAVDDSIPIHEVTMALGQARLSVELALQVRDRLVEGYREVMNMQI